MSAQETALAALGAAKETTPGVYVAPTIYIPATGIKFKNTINAIKDNSLKANDSTLQGQYPGSASSSGSFDTMAYPNELAFLIRAMGLVDTVTAAGSTTLASATAIGAATISTAAAVPAGTVVLIDTGFIAEARYTTSSGGALNLPLVNAHASGAAVTYLTKHSFAQAAYPQPQAPSVSWTDLEVTRTQGYPGCKQSQLDIKLDSAAGIGVTSSWIGFPGTTVSNPTPVFTAVEPMMGWQWQASLGVVGGAGIAARYQTATYSFKRGVEVVPGADALQGPLEVFSPDLDISVAIKAKFDVTTDADTFINYVQTLPLTAVVASARTGAGLVITLSKPVFSDFATDRGGKYVTADISADAIFNATDGGSASLAVFAPQTTAF